MEKELKNDPVVNAMFSVGAHYGYSKSRRHPSMKPYIFGTKNRVEIFDLEKTKTLLDEAKTFVRDMGRLNKQILFASSKPEALEIMKAAAISLEMPYAAGRWVGGTLTNFSNIRQRVEKMISLEQKKEKGELNMYTKKERLLIDREIAKLESLFSGLVALKSLPAAVFVIDSEKEVVAVTEARKLKIPVVALMSSDCNVAKVDYPILGNDSSIESIQYFVKEIASAYKEGRSGADLKAGK